MATQERRLPLGKIEPNSLKYFLSCGVGGIIGMSKAPHLKHALTIYFSSLWYVRPLQYTTNAPN
jgi:hypothetical protein